MSRQTFHTIQMRKVIYSKYGSIDDLKIVETGTPLFKENELLIKVKAVAINPLDWKIIEGDLKIITGSKLPKGIAFDFAGIVEKKGNLISQYEIGDEVFGVLDAMKGEALAEYIIVSEQIIYKKPTSISFEKAAAMATVGATALNLFKHCNVKAGSKILINGAGGSVGMIALQIAKNKGLKITAVASGKGLEFLKKWEPENTIDYNIENIMQQNAFYDTIFELSGKLSFKKARSLMTPTSVYVSTLPFPADIITSFFNNLWSSKKHRMIMGRPTQDNYRELCKLVSENNLEIIIVKTYSMADFKEAYQFAKQGGIVGKIVFSL